MDGWMRKWEYHTLTHWESLCIVFSFPSVFIFSRIRDEKTKVSLPSQTLFWLLRGKGREVVVVSGTVELAGLYPRVTLVSLVRSAPCDLGPGVDGSKAKKNIQITTTNRSNMVIICFFSFLFPSLILCQCRDIQWTAGQHSVFHSMVCFSTKQNTTVNQ